MGDKESGGVKGVRHDLQEVSTNQQCCTVGRRRQTHGTLHGICLCEFFDPLHFLVDQIASPVVGLGV